MASQRRLLQAVQQDSERHVIHALVYHGSRCSQSAGTPRPRRRHHGTRSRTFRAERIPRAQPSSTGSHVSTRSLQPNDEGLVAGFNRTAKSSPEQDVYARYV